MGVRETLGKAGKVAGKGGARALGALGPTLGVLSGVGGAVGAYYGGKEILELLGYDPTGEIRGRGEEALMGGLDAAASTFETTHSDIYEEILSGILEPNIDPTAGMRMSAEAAELTRPYRKQLGMASATAPSNLTAILARAGL